MPPRRRRLPARVAVTWDAVIQVQNPDDVIRNLLPLSHLRPDRKKTQKWCDPIERTGYLPRRKRNKGRRKEAAARPPLEMRKVWCPRVRARCRHICRSRAVSGRLVNRPEI